MGTINKDPQTGRYDFEKPGVGHQMQKDERGAEYLKSELERLHLMATENGMVKPGTGAYNAFCDLIDLFAGIAVNEADRYDERD